MTASESAPLHLRHVPDRDGPGRNGPSDRPASPCRCRARRRSATHGGCARAIGVEQRPLGLGMAEQRRRAARMEAAVVAPSSLTIRRPPGPPAPACAGGTAPGDQPLLDRLPDFARATSSLGLVASTSTQRCGSWAPASGIPRAGARGRRCPSASKRSARPLPRRCAARCIAWAAGTSRMMVRSGLLSPHHDALQRPHRSRRPPRPAMP